MRKWLSLGLCGLLSGAWAAPAPTAGPRADFDEFCRSIKEGYAYFDAKTTRWDAVCEHYRAGLAADADRRALMRTLEGALGELYDNHVQLGSSDAESARLVPTGAVLWAEWESGRAMVREVLRDSGAERAGLRAGMEILAIDGKRIDEAAARYAPRFLAKPDPEADSWALQTALAGLQNKRPIRLTVRQDEATHVIEYLPTFERPKETLTFSRHDGLAYVRINNSLGDDRTVKAFDQALEQLEGSKGLILDLRDTPSGGNSTVARGIMGRLVATESPYQIHEQVWDERMTGVRRRWVEHVIPRGRRFAAPVAVLVGHWTGSMGEGLAIGLNGARKAAVIGTPMARLRGAVFDITLPHSRLTVKFPTEKLFHVDGTPREAFLPCPARTDFAAADATLATAIMLLKGQGAAMPETKAGCLGEFAATKKDS